MVCLAECDRNGSPALRPADSTVIALEAWNARVPLNHLLLCKLAARFQRFPLLGLQTIAALYRQSHSDLIVAQPDQDHTVRHHQIDHNCRRSTKPTSSYSVLNYLR